MKSVLSSATALMLAAFATATLAQNAQLSGTWRLDAQHSFVGGDHLPNGYVQIKVITQHGDIVEESDQESHVSFFGAPRPDSHWNTRLVTDDTERRAMAAPLLLGLPPSEAMVAAEWQGNNLVIHARGEGSFGGVWTSEHRYFLSADGMRLTELVTLRASNGSREQRLVFVRLPTGQSR